MCPGRVAQLDQLPVAIHNACFYRGGDVVQEFRLNNVDACEGKSVGMAFGGNVCNIEVVVNLNLVEGLAVMEDQSGQASILAMGFQGMSRINIC
jgi:hypothetical protein